MYEKEQATSDTTETTSAINRLHQTIRSHHAQAERITDTALKHLAAMKYTAYLLLAVYLVNNVIIARIF